MGLKAEKTEVEELKTAVEHLAFVLLENFLVAAPIIIVETALVTGHRPRLIAVLAICWCIVQIAHLKLSKDQLRLLLQHNIEVCTVCILILKLLIVLPLTLWSLFQTACTALIDRE